MREPEPPTVRARSRVIDRVQSSPTLNGRPAPSCFFMIAQTLVAGKRRARRFYILFGRTIR